MFPQLASPIHWRVEHVLGVRLLVASVFCLALVGCEKKEKVLDVNTPGVQIEINKTTGVDGEKSIEVETKKPEARETTRELP